MSLRIIISPAKKMVEDDSLSALGMPVFLERAERLRDWILSLPYSKQKLLWKCSDAIAQRSAADFERMDLASARTPALLAYDGIQYTYMAPSVFEDGQLDYVEDHLRILSGFYGVLRPFDAVAPYRLELQTKAEVGGCANLYEFWGDALYQAVLHDSNVLSAANRPASGGPGACRPIIVNLASKEYSKAVERYLVPEDTFITCVFGELQAGRVVQKGVYAKMARGQMVRYLASIRADEPEQLKGFDQSGYAFDEARSTAKRYVFVR